MHMNEYNLVIESGFQKKKKEEELCSFNLDTY